MFGSSQINQRGSLGPRICQKRPDCISLPSVPDAKDIFRNVCTFARYLTATSGKTHERHAIYMRACSWASQQRPATIVSSIFCIIDEAVKHSSPSLEVSPHFLVYTLQVDASSKLPKGIKTDDFKLL